MESKVHSEDKYFTAQGEEKKENMTGYLVQTFFESTDK